jgi:ArsR family transcriptional regulator
MKRGQIGLSAVAAVLAALADPVRLRILRLVRQRELCVCELVDALGMPQYKVSRHLGALRKTKIVTARRRGRWMHYRLDARPEAARVASQLMGILAPGVKRAPEAKDDSSRLASRLRLRRAGQCVVGGLGERCGRERSR